MLYADATDIAAQKGGEGPVLRYHTAQALLELRNTCSAKRICLSVVDLNGREQLRQVYANTSDVQLILSALPAGEYICRANVDGKVITRKIIKL